MEVLLVHYLGNQRASLILIVQIALPCVSRIVPHTVSHTSRKRLEFVSNAYHNRNATHSQHNTPLFVKVQANKCKVEALYAVDINSIAKVLPQEEFVSLAAALLKIMQDPWSSSARPLAFFGSWLCEKCLATTTVALHHKLCHTHWAEASICRMQRLTRL
jgi:hypothetical protein